MKIATWNVNSIRQREKHVASWLERYASALRGRLAAAFALALFALAGPARGEPSDADFLGARNAFERGDRVRRPYWRVRSPGSCSSRTSRTGN